MTGLYNVHVLDSDAGLPVCVPADDALAQLREAVAQLSGEYGRDFLTTIGPCTCPTTDR